MTHLNLDPAASYYDRGGVSTLDFIEAKELSFAEGCIVKYVTRWRWKSSDRAAQLRDLEKARVYLDVLIGRAKR